VVKIKNKKIKNKLLLGLIIALIILVAAFVVLLNCNDTSKQIVSNQTFERKSDLIFNYEITKYPSHVQVSEVDLSKDNVTVGVVIDPWNLDFGIIPIGNNYGTRFVDLSNMKNQSATISFKTYGNITPFVKYSNNDFILSSNDKESVKVIFYATAAPVGNYSGEIDVIVKTVKYDFLSFLLR
jgi:hypothetical protein